jgi:PAS domain S-box-containing protein
MQRKLQVRLDAAEETLRALRSGEVDGIVLSGDCVYTLKGADEAYRLMVENMSEGALAIAPDGLILFSNAKFASILDIPHERIIGSNFHEFIIPEDAHIFSMLLAHKPRVGVKREVRLKVPSCKLIPVSLSFNRLNLDGVDCFGVIVADLTDQKRNEEVLHGLSARLLQVQDEDRRSIARGLHDGAFQRLAALEFKLALTGQSTLELPPAIQQSLSECRALVGECCYELGNLACLIQPPLLDEQGLGPALRAYINGYNRKHGPQIRVHLPRRLVKLPAHVETTLFRIAQEALTNIERHSGSATADIRFINKPGGITLEITDHGRGISKKILRQLNSGTALYGIGIAGMRERIRQLGGLIKISSGSRGTKVRVSLQIKSLSLNAQPA